ncbi:MAG: hypothetical protein MJ247_07975 [Alphaproteobacteria bacterium]|nr:hypothetical protein [Alphaproteobacteria bacterium]
MLKEALEQTNASEEKVKQYKLHGVNVNATSSEEKFVVDLFDSLASIPTGRKALQDMAKYDVQFKLESALGSAGGYFDPENNEIVMAKSLGMDFMEFALVHEARHLLQNNQGRNEAEAQNLDYGTRLMINRATEADAQCQAILACKEWEAQGHLAPLKRFEKHYPPMINAYNEKGSISDAFKGWYKDDRIASSYEFGYDIEPALNNLVSDGDDRPLVSLKPEEISKFCGGDRVDDFNGFMNSKEAKQIHLLTQASFAMYDAVNMACGGEHDKSIENAPLRELKDNTAAKMYCDKYLKETKEEFNSSTKEDNGEKIIYSSVDRMINAVEKIDTAAKEGKKSKVGEKELKNEKIFMYVATQMFNNNNFTEEMMQLPSIPKEVSAKLKSEFKDFTDNDPVSENLKTKMAKDISALTKSNNSTNMRTRTNQSSGR